MKNNQGTPNSMLEALINGLLSGPMNEVPESLEASVKDFLSQGLTKAAFRYENSPEALEAIQYLTALWEIGRKPQSPDVLVTSIMSGDIDGVAKALGLRKAE